MLACGWWHHAAVVPQPIPLTVIGGYLGAGKTTLINQLLRHPGGRRIGVIVNDFGSLAIDAALLAAAGGDDVVSLVNGCVCCTVGAGLHEALAALTERAIDHVVIEVSGVADPAVAAAWATVPPFEPAGVVVLADVTTVAMRASDKYVGTEVRRQLAGADLVLVTKLDVSAAPDVAAVRRWVTEASGGAPQLEVVDGVVPADVILGVRPGAIMPGTGRLDHDDRYSTWSWTSDQPASLATVEAMIASLPDSIMRLKGFVRLDDGNTVIVQVVGRWAEIRPTAAADRSQLVAIGLSDECPSPFAQHFG